MGECSGEEYAPTGMPHLKQELIRAMNLNPAGFDAHPSSRIFNDLISRMECFDHDHDDPVREIVARLGDRWSTLLLLILEAGTFRHAALRRIVSAVSSEKAISQRMLTLRLRTLERDGLVQRKVIPVQPPHVHYSLTPLGQELVAIVKNLLQWIESNHADIMESRSRFSSESCL